MKTQEAILTGYKGISNCYDALLSAQSMWARLFCKLIWGFPIIAYADELLAWLPDDFVGKLLDVPVGTGQFTAAKYARMSGASITCLDYSSDMMGKAQKRFADAGLSNIKFTLGDVGALPFEDSAFDTVLSMNGFHAFPDKEAAYREIFRVLSPGGLFIGCFYVKGEKPRTDWFIKHFYVPRHYFTPPFETKDGVYNRLCEMYAEVEQKSVGGIVYFRCVK
ncbi:MAG: class I SAM-dependent methyltransferase [Tannerella sp.]|jgi:ubiquinone/menaquinone biosynthesis C-methylase UbiE|nr:class I SAM-dependent methyltransferase [Tannerella sp.]